MVVEALAAGEQLFLLRKGGIRDPKGAFQLEHREFFLYPTWEHQNETPEVRIRPEFRARYKALFSQPHQPAAVALNVYAGVAYVGQVQDPAQLARLEKYHIWTPEFLQQRMKYRPQAPTLVVVLRAYRLPDPVRHPVKPEYAGCKSWVPLTDAIPVEGAVPIIENQRFRQALETISSQIE